MKRNLVRNLTILKAFLLGSVTSLMFTAISFGASDGGGFGNNTGGAGGLPGGGIIGGGGVDPIPEPATWALFGVGAAFLAYSRKRGGRK